MCAQCQSANTTKLLTPPTIHFKGSGFYKTDTSTPKKSDTAPVQTAETKKETTATTDAKPAPTKQDTE